MPILLNTSLNIAGDPLVNTYEEALNAIKQAGGKVIRLTREFKEDAHSSECALDKHSYDWNNFDFIIDNSKGDTDKFCKELNFLFKELEL